MAVTVVTPVALGKFNAFTLDAVAFATATTAADGFTVDLSGFADQKAVFLLQNTNSGSTVRTATIKAGNGLQGVSDLVSGNIAAGKIAAVSVESGAFMNVSGDDKGKVVVVPSNAELKLAVVVLP
ncbi:MAG: hypothetical protein M0R40_10920 [Firmicutes bacterium]|nr:hypothetical protein [Bacillota bacterium]